MFTTPLPALEVAAAFVAFCNEHGDFVSNLKLQRLLYYAQGWYLALYEERLFAEELESWVHGPVVPAVFAAYRHFGHGPVEPAEALSLASFAPELIEHIADVWGAYGALTAFDLEILAQNERPWLEARNGLAPDDPSAAAIQPQVMYEYFLEKAHEQNPTGEPAAA